MNFATLHPFLVKWLVMAAALFVCRFLFRSSMRLHGISTALMAALVLCPVNVFISEIARWLHFPTNEGALYLLAAGLNGVLLFLSSAILPGFEIKSAPVGIVVALLVSLAAVALAHILHNPNLAPI